MEVLRSLATEHPLRRSLKAVPVLAMPGSWTYGPYEGPYRSQYGPKDQNNPSEGPQTGFLLIFDRFFGVWGSRSGLKMLLGPVRSFSRSRFLISSILDPFRLNFGLLGRPQYCVFLQDRECSSSATRQFSPNPSYLHSGEFVLPWDMKNRSRIEIRGSYSVR